MEGFLAIIGFIIGIAILNAILSGAKSAVDTGVAHVKYGTLSVRMRESTFQHNDVSLPGISIAVKGIVPNRLAGVRLVVHLFDTTNAPPAPLTCLNDSLQEETTRFFQLAPAEVIPSGSAFTDWAEILHIPRIILLPPRQGRRTIQCTLSVIPADSHVSFVAGERVLGVAPIRVVTDSTSVTFDNPGYLDLEASRTDFYRLSVQALVLMAAVDGEVSAPEKQRIENWIAKVCTSLARSSPLRNQLPAFLLEALKNHSTLDLEQAFCNLRDSSDEADRYEVIDVCTDVLAADGVLRIEERVLLDRAVDWLGLDPAIAKAALDQGIAKGKIGIAASSQDYADLGIHPGMSEEEVMKTLTAEYRKWNARTTHDNPEIRERAQRMTERIAEARGALLTR